jgi:hypothetical protein
VADAPPLPVFRALDVAVLHLDDGETGAGPRDEKVDLPLRGPVRDAQRVEDCGVSDVPGVTGDAVLAGPCWVGGARAVNLYLLFVPNCVVPMW